LMAVPGFIDAVRGGHRHEGLLIGGQAALVTIFYSLYVFWNGGVAWGPRHLTDIMPAVALLSSCALANLFGDGTRQTARNWMRAAVLGLLILSVATQASASVVYDHTRENDRYVATDPTVTPEMTLEGLLSIDLAPQVNWFRGFITPVWTVLWAPDGRVKSWELGWRIGLLVIDGAAIWLIWHQKHSRIALGLQLAGTLILAFVMIGHVARSGADNPFSELIQTAETSAGEEDQVLTVLPDSYLPWLLGYTGPARDIGLSSEALLTDSSVLPPGSPGSDESLVWLVTDGPPGTSNVEGWLSESAYRGSELWFDAHYRLIPFHFADTPTNMHKVGADFGNGQAQLVEAGYSVTARGLDVYCLWATNEWEEGDINTFLHLIGPDGTLAAQIDGPLLVESEGTVEQRQYLLLPETLPAGEYMLFTGLYHWQTGVRIPLADGSGDRVTLGSVILPGG